jgi:RNA polymerase sigma factor (sigma-70 family)
MIADEMSQLLGQRLAELPPIEQHILRWRFGLDRADERTLREIGDDLSLSRERIRQLQNRALKTLRRLLDLEQHASAERPAPVVADALHA